MKMLVTLASKELSMIKISLSTKSSAGQEKVVNMLKTADSYSDLYQRKQH